MDLTNLPEDKRIKRRKTRKYRWNSQDERLVSGVLNHKWLVFFMHFRKTRIVPTPTCNPSPECAQFGFVQYQKPLKLSGQNKHPFPCKGVHLPRLLDIGIFATHWFLTFALNWWSNTYCVYFYIPRVATIWKSGNSPSEVEGHLCPHSFYLCPFPPSCWQFM